MKKIFISAVSFLAIFGFVYFSTPAVKAMTIDELLAQIAALQQQIVSLQQQLATVKGEQPAAWCHDFNINLKFGDSGTEVKALRTALTTEGFSGLEAMGGAYEFDEQIASAVVAFQEKYASEVLASWGLVHGTGVVGPTTRKKLNSLYGCGITSTPPTPVTPSITVISPNGGEILNDNSNYSISWKYGGNIYSQIDILLQIFGTGGKKFNDRLIAAGVSTSKMSYSWNPKVLVSASDFPEGAAKYKILIREANDSVSAVSDTSDNYFSIVAAATTKLDKVFVENLTTAGNPVSYKVITAPSLGDKISGATFYWQYEMKNNLAQDVELNYQAVYFSSGKEIPSDILGGGAIVLINNGVSDYYKLGSSAALAKGGQHELHFSLSMKTPLETDLALKITITKVGSQIPAPSITVISPNGGEKWAIGSAQTIKWNSTGFNYVLIDLIRGDGASGSFTSSAQPGQFVWQVPSHLSAGNDYKIRVMGIDSLDLYNEAGKSDLSDNYFSIIATATTAQPSINISGSSGSQTSSSTLQVNLGDTFTISGIPQNLQGLLYWFGSGYPPAGYYNRAYFFDQAFGNNNSCGNNEASTSGPWTMTCTAKVAGSSDIYIEIYANGKIYKSNVVSVTILPAVTPSITGISPSYGYIGDTINLVIDGKNFTGASAYSSWCGLDTTAFQGLEAKGCGVTSDSQMYAKFVISSLAISGNRYINVRTGSGGASNSAIFEVRKATDSDNSPDYTYGISSYPITPEKYPDLFTDGVGKGNYVGGGPCLYGTELNPTFCKSTSLNFTTYYDHCASLTQLNEAFVNAEGKLGVVGVQPPSGYECRNGAFASVKPSITVVSPNGGEQWAVGKTYDIKWSTKWSSFNNNNNPMISVNLVDYYKNVTYEIGTYPADEQTSAMWTIPSYIFNYGETVNGNYFKISVSENTKAGASDESNDYFSIAQTVSYPGFFMTPDKYSYSGGDTINLKISRADNKTFPYFVDLYLVRQSDDSKTLFSKNIDVTSPTTVQIPAGEKYGVFTSSGNYTLLICAGGEICGSGANTNSTAIYYTAVVPIACTDSDGGNSIYSKGTVNIKNSKGIQWNYTDYCQDSAALQEYSCLSDSSAYTDDNAYNAYSLGYNQCSYGCSSGACLSAPIIIETPAATTSDNTATTTITGACTDSDGGKDIYQMGTAKDADESQTDSCSVYSSNRILEWWCRDNTSVEGYYEDCPAGYSCSAGACVSAPTSSLTPENQLADISKALGKMLEEINKLLGR